MNNLIETLIFVLLCIAVLIILVTSEIRKNKAMEAWQSEKKQRKEYELELYTRFLRLQDENWGLECEIRKLKEENATLKNANDSLSIECARMAEYIETETTEETANED